MKIKRNQQALVLQLYADGLEQGLGPTAIAHSINDKLNLDCAESTYRSLWRRHELEKILFHEEQEEIQDHYTRITKREVANKLTQKQLVRQRAVVDIPIKRLADGELLKEIIKETFGKPATIYNHHLLEHAGDTGARYIPAYCYGDVHWDYTINEPEKRLFYNVEEAKRKLDEVFSYIVLDTRKHNYKKIYVSDQGDDIEGSALRASQLLHIMNAMTRQAEQYSRYLAQKIKWLSEQLPEVEIVFIHIADDNHSQLRLHGTSRDELPEMLQHLVVASIQMALEAYQDCGHCTNVQYVAAGEAVIDFEGLKGLFIHGHQYAKSDNILSEAGKRHETKIHFAVVAHWHSYAHKNKDLQRGIQESLIFLPAIVGQTDHAERNNWSGRAGFVKLKVYPKKKYTVSKQILFDE